MDSRFSAKRSKSSILNGKSLSLLAAALLWFCSSNVQPANAYQERPGRQIFLTLIPNYAAETVEFDGRIEQYPAPDEPDLEGLPFDVRDPDPWLKNNTWYIIGTISGAKLDHVRYDRGQRVFRLSLGPFHLRPLDELHILFPFVSLYLSEIQPEPEQPEPRDTDPLFQNHRLIFRGGAEGREFTSIEIPFVPAVKTIDLVITPLMGEAFIGRTDSFRLSGRVLFESLLDFEEFAHQCQNAASRLELGDYRSASVLESLDFPHFFSPDVLNPDLQFKPTSVVLRSQLVSCQYDREKGVGQVEASFSGRVSQFKRSDEFFPVELQGSDSLDENSSLGQGYKIRLGRILLAPGDRLTIAIPGAVIRADDLDPVPDRFTSAAGQESVVEYAGAWDFELTLPYMPHANLYLRQFPAILRPGVVSIEERLQRTVPITEKWSILPFLAAGILLLLASAFARGRPWLAGLGWVLVLAGLYYGMRGSFGWLTLAAAFYIGQVVHSNAPIQVNFSSLGRVLIGLAGFAVVFLGIDYDAKSTDIFRGLSDAELSPFTPLVLALVVVSLFALFYGFPRDAKIFRGSDLPVLLLFLLVLALYDAFDKSFLSLLIIILGGIYLARRFSSGYGKPVNDADTFGSDLQERLTLVLGNRLMLFSILALIVFAIGHDLTSLYGNELIIKSSWPAAPLVLPLLDVVSIIVTLVSVAVLFILVYPFLPFTSAYLKAVVFASFLFLVFLFGIGTDHRLILSLPNILVGRVIYYLSIPLLIGLYLDIHEFTEREKQRRSAEDKDEKGGSASSPGSIYLKNLQGYLGTALGIVSVIAPSLYAFVSDQPVITTYFSLLEQLVHLRA